MEGPSRVEEGNHTRAARPQKGSGGRESQSGWRHQGRHSGGRGGTWAASAGPWRSPWTPFARPCHPGPAPRTCAAMPIPRPPTAPIDLDALDAFLMSDRAPEDSMGLSDLDGFLTGVVVGPELIMPSEWTRVIWGGGEGPDFESMEEALAIHGTLTGRYNAILRCLATEPESFDPVFWEGPEGKVIVTDWAAGFLEAVRLRPRAWEPLIRHEEASALIAPL